MENLGLPIQGKQGVNVVLLEMGMLTLKMQEGDNQLYLDSAQRQREADCNRCQGLWVVERANGENVESVFQCHSIVH